MIPPTYWRTVPFYEFCTLIKRMNRKHDVDEKKPRTVTGKDGKKKRVVPVLDAK